MEIVADGSSVADGFARALGIILEGDSDTKSRRVYAYGKLVKLSVYLWYNDKHDYYRSVIRFEKRGIEKLITDDKKREALDEF